MKRKLFCGINPTCYKISVQKEILKRHLKDLFSSKKYAKEKTEIELPNIVLTINLFLVLLSIT